MSKLKISPDDRQNREILARIDYGRKKFETTNHDLALTARMTPQTYCHRLKNPGDFTLDELRAIARKVHMPLTVLLGEAPIN